MPNGEAAQTTDTILKSLGKAAPWVIVAAMIAVAVYFFREQEIASRASLIQLAEDKIQNAHDRNLQEMQSAWAEARSARKEALATTESYEKITDILILRIEKLMNIAEQMEQERESQTRKLESLRADVIRLTETAERAEKQVESYQQRVLETQAELASADTNLAQLTLDLQNKRDELVDVEEMLLRVRQEKDRLERHRVQQVGNLTTELRELAEAVSNPDSISSDRLSALATTILNEMVPVEIALKQYASSPSDDTAEQLQVLIARDIADVDAAAQAIGEKFEEWIRVTEDGSVFDVIGTGRSEYGYGNWLVLAFDNGKISDVQSIVGPILLVRTYTTDNWYVERQYWVNGEGEEEQLKGLTNTWTIESVLSEEGELGKLGSVIKELVLQDQPPFPVIGVAKFREVSATAFEKAKERVWSRFSEALLMSERAEGFRADSIRVAQDVPDDVLSVFRKIADASVIRKPDSVVAFLDSSLTVDNLGRFAAVVLKKEFRITGFREEGDHRYVVEGVYRRRGYEEVQQGVEFEFGRGSRSGDWILRKFGITAN